MHSVSYKHLVHIWRIYSVALVLEWTLYIIKASERDLKMCPVAFSPVGGGFYMAPALPFREDPC